MIQDNKIIIENQSSLNIKDAIDFVDSVISRGKESDNGKQYCFVSVYEWLGNKYAVYCFINKKSYRFVVRDEK